MQDWKNERKLARKEFFAAYGENIKITDDDTWLGWLGIWMAAWQACLKAHEETGTGSDLKP